MSEIMRRNALPPTSRRTRQIVASASEATLAEQVAMRAVSATAEYGMSEVLFLKQTQAALEQQCPDAAEALALIANSAALSIAQQVRRFGQQMSG
ncbi:hypothetical protein [Streptomyces pluripotens]|uniref:hypothetical protein n=1 Tax=Streptomyces pluripotens TaxID=1355015 RepID=UPI00131B4FF1|nr:hypothetical protein [Streptomyces pluripotens]